MEHPSETTVINYFFKIVLPSLLGLGFFLLSFSDALAASYYSAPSGSGSTCSQSAPCSLNSGIGKLVAGDSLYLRGGTYNGTVNISKSGTSGSLITVSGYTGETAIVDGGGSMGEYSSLFTISGNYVHLSDLEIKGGGM